MTLRHGLGAPLRRWPLRLALVAVLAVATAWVVAAARPAGAGVSGAMLHNAKTGMCADLPGFGPGGLNTPVNQFHCNGGSRDNQRWNIVDAGNGLFWIQNQKSGLCMDLPGTGSFAPGTAVSQYTCRNNDNQLWYWYGSYPGGRYIVNGTWRLCLDVRGGGPDARLTVWYCNPNDDHIWAPAYAV